MMCAMMCVLVSSVIAAGQDNLQKYFSDTACKVKATADPSEKRAILSERLQDMSTALDRVENSTLVSEADRPGLDRFRATLQERQNELAGADGYDRVPDAQLNAFSDFVVQDGEQADRTITISLVVLLLIVIIIILVV
jgi:septal ring factor EnvC (AmiA/AmiB activator)